MIPHELVACNACGRPLAPRHVHRVAEIPRPRGFAVCSTCARDVARIGEGERDDVDHAILVLDARWPR